MPGGQPRSDYNIEFPVILSGEGDCLRVRIKTFHGEVVDFVVQYEMIFAGREYPVVRYDGSHSFPHCDVLDVNGATIKKLTLPGAPSFAQAVDMAIRDLKANWRRYREDFVRRMP